MQNIIDPEFYIYSDKIAGIGVSGVRSIAGPIVACCYILAAGDHEKQSLNFLSKINDPSELPEWRRAKVVPAIVETGVAFGFGIVDAATVDAIGQNLATSLAISKAIKVCSGKTKCILHDSNLNAKEFATKSDVTIMSIDNGSKKSAVIACATLMARYHRDELMKGFDEVYPGYSFKKNKGHLDDAHLKGLDSSGLLVGIHRLCGWPFIGNSRKGPLLVSDSRRKNWRVITHERLKRSVYAKR